MAKTQGEKPVNIHTVLIMSASTQKCLTLETTKCHKVVVADLIAGEEDTATCEIHLFGNLNSSPISLILKNDTKKFQLLYTEDYKVLLKDDNLPSTKKLIVQTEKNKNVSFHCIEDMSMCLCIKNRRVVFDRPDSTTMDHLFQMKSRDGRKSLDSL